MSLSSFANSAWLKTLPNDAFEHSVVEFYPFSPSSQWLSTISVEQQQRALETWFLHRFCSPKNRVPYDLKRRQYTFLNGGPFSAEYELVSRFHLQVSEKVIMDAVTVLESNGDKLWILRTGAVLESSFGKCQIVEPFQIFDEKLTELYRLVHQMPADISKSLVEVVFFEAIRNFELYCVELTLHNAASSTVIAERLIRMLLVSHNDSIRIPESSSTDDTVLNLLRQRLLVVPWYHWPTFVYLFKDGLQFNVSSLAANFGRVYSSNYRRRFGYMPLLHTKQADFSVTKLHHLKLSLLRLAKMLHELSVAKNSSDRQ